jgi:hypothetical protein
MANKKIYAGLSSMAIATLIATSLPVVAHAADGDIYSGVGTSSTKDLGSVSQVILSNRAAFLDMIQNMSSYGYGVGSSIYKVSEVNTEFTNNPTFTPAQLQADVKAKLTAVQAITPAAATVSSVATITVPAVTVGTVATLPTTTTVTLSDGTTKTANITWNAAATAAATYATAGTVTVNGTLADYSNYAVSASVTVNAVPATLAISSVTPLNAKQIQVVFNKPVTAASVLATPTATTSLVKSGIITAAQITGTGTTITSNSLGAVLSSDGLTLTLTATTGEYFGGTYSLVANNGIIATTGEKLAPYATTFTENDTTKPDITSVTAATAGTTASNVDIKFTEPVAAGALIQVDGTTIGTTVAGNETILSSLSIAAGTHTLSVVNLTDGASNVATSVSKSFTTTVDNTLPTVTMAQYSDTAFELTFSKKMDTVANNFGALGTSNITVTDSSLTSYTATVTADPADTTGTKFVVTLSGAAATNLYLNGTSKNLTVTLADGLIKDSLGNKLAGITLNGTLAKDSTAPNVTGITYQTDSSSKLTNIVLTFDKSLPAQTTANANTIKVIDANGVDQTAKFFSGTVAMTAGNTVTIPVLTAATDAGNLAMPNTLVNGSYTFVVPNTFVHDNAQTQNNNNAYTGTINFGTPTAGTLTVTAASGGTNIYTLTYGVEPKGGNVTGSATLASNYLLNGSALPAGAVITKAANVVTVDLSNCSIPTSNSTSVLTAMNVQSLDGSQALTTVANTVATVDNVKPVLTSAKIQSANSILLTFNENVQNSSATHTVGDEFIVKANGTVVSTLDGTIGNVANLTATPVTGFSNEMVLTAAAGAVPTAGTITYSNTTVGAATLAAPTVTGYTGIAAKNYVLKVATCSAPGIAATYTVSTDGGNTFSGSYAVGSAQTIANGVSVNVTAGTVDAVGDLISFTVTPVFDMSKTVTITTKTQGANYIEDTSSLANPTHAGDTVTIGQ